MIISRHIPRISKLARVEQTAHVVADRVDPADLGDQLGGAATTQGLQVCQPAVAHSYFVAHGVMDFRTTGRRRRAKPRA